MGISRHAHAFLTAVGLLTRIPVSSRMVAPGEDPAPLRDAVAYFPAVGALVGLATGTVIASALHVWPPAVAVVLGLTFEAVVTGGLHEDAVADVCDAFGGGWTREDILRILKDSRVGSFGALGLGLAVLLRAGATAALPPADLLAATVAASSWGRWVILPIMACVPAVSDRPGSARDFGQGVHAREVGVGLLWALAAMLPFLAGRPRNAAAAIVASGLFLAWFISYLRRRLGGVTGDCLGAAAYAGQLLVLLAAGAGAGAGGGTGSPSGIRPDASTPPHQGPSRNRASAARWDVPAEDDDQSAPRNVVSAMIRLERMAIIRAVVREDRLTHSGRRAKTPIRWTRSSSSHREAPGHQRVHRRKSRTSLPPKGAGAAVEVRLSLPFDALDPMVRDEHASLSGQLLDLRLRTYVDGKCFASVAHLGRCSPCMSILSWALPSRYGGFQWNVLSGCVHHSSIKNMMMQACIHE